LTQHFRVDVEKTSVLQDDNGGDIYLDHDFQPRFEPATLRHLGEAALSFVDESAVVISGTVSHAGFGAAYFADDCPYTKFQYLVDSFVVSNSTNQINTHGTYRQNGECESLPFYECADCDSDHYIWYYPDAQSWHIGPGGCGSASAEISAIDQGADLTAVPDGY